MPSISLVQSTEVFSLERWDAEAYSPELRRLERALAGSPSLDGLALVSHPAEIPREYIDEPDGAPFLLARNLRPILPDLTTLVRIPRPVARQLPSNRLEKGDVLVTRTGANHGVACVYLGESGDFYTSGEGLIVRRRQDQEIDSAYLAVFLGCDHGVELCRKAAYGSGQPHIGPAYLRQVPVLRLGRRMEGKIGDLVREAWGSQERVKSIYAEAKEELLDRFGWERLAEQPPELSYVESYANVAAARRCDAEHFQPQYKRLLKQLREAGALPLGDFCPIPHRGIQPDFVKGGDVWVIDSKAVRAEGVRLSADERTDRAFLEDSHNAKARIEPGDVLLNSTGRGTLGRATCYQLSGPAVADNHVSIIRPNPQVCLPLYLSLFLNSPLGMEQSEMFQTGSSGQIELYPSDIVKFLVYLPTQGNRKIDLAWQKRLADKLSTISDATATGRANLEEAKTLVERHIETRLGGSHE